MFWKLLALTKDKKVIWRTYKFRTEAEVRAICRKSGWTPILLINESW